MRQRTEGRPREYTHTQSTHKLANLNTTHKEQETGKIQLKLCKQGNRNADFATRGGWHMREHYRRN